MLEISAVTALEINNHPDDLQVSIYNVEEKGISKYGIIVCRGPGHNYKLLVTSIPFASTIAQAVDEVKNLLTGIHLWATETLSDSDSPIAQIVNPSGQVDVSQTLNPDLISRIIDELCKHQVADTSRLLITTR